VFGYDVLIDENLRPWLIEVNASPSLSRDNQLDIRVKNAMIKDTVQLIDPAPFNRESIPRILKRRLKEFQQSKSSVLNNKYDSALESDLKEILGDYVPRKFGEVPRNLGNYEMLCPGTKAYTQVMKLKRSIIKDPIHH